ncbi:MAG: Dabb family protein [Micrococcales bacterium]|nr:Dabb family protein [Micrococcales bacterium]
MITHVVMMKLHDRADSHDAAQRLLAIAGRIPDLRSIEVLVDTLDRPGAYDLVLRSTHADEAGLAGYQQHPVHQDVLTWLSPRIAQRAVVDAG